MEKRKIGITDTTLRDGQQSLIATRMPWEDIEPILSAMDNIGFHSLEVWGGATYDACLRFLKEDPWVRLRKMKEICKKTPLQMLFRGQNMLGYKAYPDDAVDLLIKKACDNGIDILRIFDALNDVRNIEGSVKAVKKSRKHAQLCISYTLSDVHTEEYFVKLAKRLVDIGADSICIKDMAGLLLPQATFDLVAAIKAACPGIPIQIHSHYTSGLAGMSYLKGIEAGADVIDTAMSPFAMGTSQPATEVMVATLKGTAFDTGLQQSALMPLTEYFAPLREKALKSGLLDTKVLSVDIDTLNYQVPGGMLSNLVSQLKQQNAVDRFGEVLREIPRVRADLGFPPLVTPSSQIVGTQALMNVLTGERYKMVPNETKDIVRGMYGTTPVPIKPEIVRAIIGDEKPISGRPADSLAPGVEKARAEIAEYSTTDEDTLSYIMFPQPALEFFKYRQAQQYGKDPKLADKKNGVYPV